MTLQEILKRLSDIQLIKKQLKEKQDKETLIKAAQYLSEGFYESLKDVTPSTLNAAIKKALELLSNEIDNLQVMIVNYEYDVSKILEFVGSKETKILIKAFVDNKEPFKKLFDGNEIDYDESLSILKITVNDIVKLANILKLRTYNSDNIKHLIDKIVSIINDTEIDDLSIVFRTEDDIKRYSLPDDFDARIEILTLNVKINEELKSVIDLRTKLIPLIKLNPDM